MQDLLQVGVISSTHGIAGEVKVFPTTDDVNRFDYLKDVILDTGREKLYRTVVSYIWRFACRIYCRLVLYHLHMELRER